MTQHEQIVVTGPDEMRGRLVAEHVAERPTDDRVTIRLDRGGLLIVHPHELRRQADGSYWLGDTSSLDVEPTPGDAGDEQRLALAEERLHVGKRQVAGKVRVHVSTQERQETVDVPLEQDVVRVERVPINREVDSPPSVREEAGTLIVPVVEEVVKVHKQLMLREEVRLIREKSQTHDPQQVTLRRETAHVEREARPGEEGPGDGETPSPRSDSNR